MSERRPSGARRWCSEEWLVKSYLRSRDIEMNNTEMTGSFYTGETR